jgi:pyruvate/2-oxoglutarate dehydrogenase complex dihydrolipoamide dehydrogenase (E3) component
MWRCCFAAPDVLMQQLAQDGIEVMLSTEVVAVEGRSGQGVRVSVRTPTGTQTFEGSHILVAAGRTPNTQDIGLDTGGITLDARGYVQVNERLVISAGNVWALGDCAGSPQFTHVAFDDFRIVRDNLNGASAPRAAAWCPIACSPTRNSGASD